MEGRSASGPGTVSAAVREHLRQLCLREFPCGTGSWNKSRFGPRTGQMWRELDPREEETVEALLDLVRSPHSPWALPSGSSTEDQFLRELAIQDPLQLKDSFFYSYFRTLRVVDKEVSLVDKDLLKFLKLEELILSANHIKEVDAANLPRTLKVLELYGNELASMESLCVHPPPPGLQHLGLGHNKLLGPLESLYVTASHWPSLVSLDLGFNDLTDLQSMMAALRSLRRLRLLVLQGNPLALVPYYRGFTIDSLAPLCVLDDITVSPNEKHQFRGLSLHGDLLAHAAQLVVTIGNIRGVLDSSVLDPEPGPEGPFASYTYYVTYDFVEDEEGDRKEYSGVLAEIVQPSPSAELLGEDFNEDFPEELGGEASEEAESAESATTELLDSELSLVSAALPRSTDSAEELAKLRPRMDDHLCLSPGTVLFSTARKPWSEVIACGYEMQHGLKDLVPLKAFLLAGTTVTVMEEKILSWPLMSPSVDSSLPTKKGKKEKDKRGKAEKESPKPPPQERKGSRRKKEPSSELRQDPPVTQVLGSCLVVLEPLLAGEPLVSTVCNFGVVRTPESDRLTFARDSKKAKKGAKKEKPKAAAPASESQYQPEALTVEVQVQLSQCRTAAEALHSFASSAAQ
ncbi:leucine-rich repeat-containing protein 43 isoform X2 [Oryctolagus cuniculus]|uniref:leucine-rich repeat-containing protein 43 isoform X2 n=1 Tax=Oryctolagus cuniculus TaxID=9986 RepID=UPI000490177F|nr:leucine-rich repeat-containing protein 43 isoform X2 [Oryctolagus cuniculus]